MVKKYFPLIILFLAALFGGVALLHPGLPPTHDGEYNIVRFFEFDKALRDGTLYPRWAPDLNFGFGIPQFNFFYPFPNYVSSFFHLFGISFIDGFKLNMFVAFFIGGYFMYLWSKNVWGKTGAIVSSIVYLFSPYQFLDIYIRGSVGEVWAMAFFPGILFAITNYIYTKRVVYIVLGSIFLAFLIFSHNILSLAFVPFAISYALFLILSIKITKKDIFSIISMFILGIGLAAIFWLPALSEAKYVQGLQVFDLERNFADIYQLLIPSWGSGFFGSSIDNEMSVQIGVINILAVLTSSFIGMYLFLKKDKKYLFIMFFLSWFIITCYLMLKSSLPIWLHVPLMHYFQFPWRFLSITVFCASFLAGGISIFHYKKIFSSIFILLAIVTTISYAKPAHYLYRKDSYYMTRPNFIDGTNSPGNGFNTIWAQGILKRVPDKLQIEQGNGKLTVKNLTTTLYEYFLFSRDGATIDINTLYFPGWEVLVDRKKIPVHINRNGSMSINVEKGNHSIKVFFSDTPIRKISLAISILSLLILFTLLLKSWYSKKKL